MPETILSLDNSIRFAAVTNRRGFIIASRYRKDVKPLMNAHETEIYALAVTIRHYTRDAWENKIGKVVYSITRYELLVRATLPIDENHLLMMSFDLDAKDAESTIVNKVVPRLKSLA